MSGFLTRLRDMAEDVDNAQKWWAASPLLREAAARIEALEAELAVECDKYGLPHDLQILLRHIYVNRDAVRALDRHSIEALEAERDEATEALREIATRWHECPHCGHIHREGWPK